MLRFDPMEVLLKILGTLEGGAQKHLATDLRNEARKRKRGALTQDCMTPELS